MYLMCSILYVILYQPDANGNIDLAGESQYPELTGEEVDALKKKYIQKLTAVLINYLPAFWKIALSVFNGKFAKVHPIL